MLFVDIMYIRSENTVALCIINSMLLQVGGSVLLISMSITGILSGQIETLLITSAEGTALASCPVLISNPEFVDFLCFRQHTYLRKSATMWPNHSCWRWWIRWWADEQPKNWCLVQTKSHPELPVIYRWFKCGSVATVLVAVQHVSHLPVRCCICYMLRCQYNRPQIFCKFWTARAHILLSMNVMLWLEYLWFHWRLCAILLVSGMCFKLYKILQKCWTYF